MENTSHESSETETQTHLSDRLEHTWKKIHHRLGTASIVACVLWILALLIILSLEHRIERLERGYGGYSRPMMNNGYRQSYNRMMYRGNDEFNWVDTTSNTWSNDDFNNQSPLNTWIDHQNDLPDQRQMIIQNIQTPTTSGDEQYSGYQMNNDQTLNYSIKSRDATMTGTIMGTDTAAINRDMGNLQRMGFSVTNTNGQIQFSGPSKNLDAVVQI